MGKLNNPSKTMKRAIRHAGGDANRPILCGVLLTAEGEAVATDSYRLSVERNVWSGDEIVVPYSVAYDLAHVKASVKSAEIESDGNTVKATLPDGTEFVDDVPAGKYPKWKALFNGEVNTAIYAKRSELLTKVREFVKEKRKEIILEATDKGEVNFGLAGFERACADGKAVRIGFNPKFVRDALNSIEGEDVTIWIEKSIRPAVFVDESNTVKVLVIPVRIDGEPKPKKATTKKKAEPKHESKPEPKPEPKPKSHPYKGRRFYIFGEVGEPIEYTTKSGSKFTFRIGHEYLCRANGKCVECMFLGYDTAKDRPCFAEVTDDGDFWYTWPGDKRTLEYMVNHTNGEPSYHTDKAAEHRVSFAEKFAEKCEEKTGIKLDVKPIPGGGLAASVAKTEPKKEDNDMELKKRIEELEAELAKRNAELESVWKENESLKRSKSEEPKPEPKTKAEPKADMPTAITLETMQAWAGERNLIATQKRPGTCIWVEGESKPYADELKELGFRFAKKRKSWYLTPAE